MELPANHDPVIAHHLYVDIQGHDLQEVDPRLGTWKDVRLLADKLDLELELMVNHVSPASTEFQDFLQRGDASEFADMFIDWDRFWPEGEVATTV